MSDKYVLPDPEHLSNEQMDQAIRWAQCAQAAADEGNYRMMRAAGSAHPCPIEGCPMSVEEHHRLMFGVMAENEAMRREIQILNHQKTEEKVPVTRAQVKAAQLMVERLAARGEPVPTAVQKIADAAPTGE